MKPVGSGLQVCRFADRGSGAECIPLNYEDV